MGDFQAFLTLEEDIYGKIRCGQENVRKNGVTPLPVLREEAKPSGGYFIALRHPHSIEEKVAGVSRSLDACVRSLVYHDSAHTSVATSETLHEFTPNHHQIEALYDQVMGVRDKLRRPTINYNDWLVTPDSVIITGIPDQNLYDALRAINDGIERKVFTGNYAIRNGGNNIPATTFKIAMPKMAHITASRAREFKTADELRKCGWFDIIESAPALGESKCTFIDVGYWIVTPRGYEWNPCKRFEF